MSVGEVITNMNIPVPVGDQLGFYSDGKELSTDFIFEEDITVVVGLKQGKKKWIAPIAAIAIAVIAPLDTTPSTGCIFSFLAGETTTNIELSFYWIITIVC